MDSQEITATIGVVGGYISFNDCISEWASKWARGVRISQTTNSIIKDH